MFRFFTLLIVAFFVFFYSDAQTLYQSRDIKQAYRKQTRSIDGKPGKKYWQNSGRYDITVTALPPERTIRGTEKITYTNNSPDTLKSIIIKLILNNHRPEASRYGNVSPDYLTTGITIDTFIVNGSNGLWKKNMGSTTWQEVTLTEPLFPGRSLQLNISWHYPVSLQSGREGMIDSTTYYLAYFYPRIAVYDDYNGWDKIDFTGGPEFYNDFNDYTLKVRVPANYVVWGTGDLLNSSDVLVPAIIKRLQQSMQTDSVVHIASKEELAAGKITVQKKINTWEFNARHITDMAVGISNHFVWDAASTVVDSSENRRAGMQAAYSDTASAFREMVRDGAHALNWFSHNLPGVPYPFPKMTAFQGNADMEYPMMINDTAIEGLEGRRVTNHEIAHTWFPFYMGTNETRYAFMDEAWATTLELMIASSYTDKTGAEEVFRKGRVGRWINNPSPATDLPIITPSYELKEGYRTNAYGKPSLAYQALKDMLGDTLFKKCLQEYMSRWNGKHPVPWDFFYTFNDASGKNLNWFWSNWFFSGNYIDLGIGGVVRTDQGYTVTVDNKGGFAIPFDIRVTYSDGTNSVFHQTPQVWAVNEKKAVINLGINKKIKSVDLDGNIFIDTEPADNVWGK